MLSASARVSLLDSFCSLVSLPFSGSGNRYSSKYSYSLFPCGSNQDKGNLIAFGALSECYFHMACVLKRLSIAFRLMMLRLPTLPTWSLLPDIRRCIVLRLAPISFAASSMLRNSFCCNAMSNDCCGCCSGFA